MKNIHRINGLIYITSEEDIKTGYYLDLTYKIVMKSVFYTSYNKNCKKVILSNDPALISDGIQAINPTDENWLNDNPSCEEVNVREMKINLKIEKEFEVKYLLAEVGPRYWEDATVNGEEDSEGNLIPCRDGEYWKPLIDIETGIIVNWEKGKIADIHYKCCDDGFYKLLDENKQVVKSINGYVPDIMCPKKEGYGDYVIMDVDSEGKIQKWKVDLSYFLDDDE